jgi:hypothetical protein
LIIFDYSTFSKFVERIEVLLKYDNNKGYFTQRRFYIYVNIFITFLIVLKIKTVSDKAAEKIKRDFIFKILCSQTGHI